MMGLVCTMLPLIASSMEISESADVDCVQQSILPEDYEKIIASILADKDSSLLYEAVACADLDFVTYVLRDPRAELLTGGYDRIQQIWPVHLAAQQSLEMLTLVLSATPQVFDTPSGATGCTPLFHAIKAEKADCVKKLMRLGASTDHKNLLGQTPLTYAEFLAEHRNGSPEMVKLLAGGGGLCVIQ